MFIALWFFFILIAYLIVFLLQYFGVIGGFSMMLVLYIMVPLLILFNLFTYYYADKMSCPRTTSR